MYFVATYVRDGDLHEKEFNDYDALLEWVDVLKEIKARKIRKFVVDAFDNWYELK